MGVGDSVGTSDLEDIEPIVCIFPPPLSLPGIQCNDSIFIESTYTQEYLDKYQLDVWIFVSQI